MVATIYPSGGWGGTAGSGYGVTPSDPTRTTAKPIILLNDVPNQVFTSDFTLGVFAAANGGITKVRCYCEGNTVDITDWSYNSRTASWEYSVTLAHSSFGQDGYINLYFEAYPTDGTMQNRVIGPFKFYRATGSAYDKTLTLDGSQASSGDRYQTLVAALNAIVTNGTWIRPLIQVTSSGNYATAAINVPFGGFNCWTTIEPANGVTATFNSGTSSQLRPRYDGIKWSGINFDFASLSNYVTDTSPAHTGVWFHNCSFTNSLGRNSLVPTTLEPSIGTVTGPAAWYATNCTFSSYGFPLARATLARGCTLTNQVSDTFQDANFVYNTTVSNIDNTGLRNELPTLTIRYSGAGTVATVAKTGANLATGSLVLVVDGSTVLTQSLASGTSPSTIAAAINGVSGWSATVLDNTRSGRVLSKVGASLGAFTATDAKSADLTLVAGFDLHSDLSQLAQSRENFAYVNIKGTDLQDAQQLFWTYGTSTGTYKDGIMINCAFDRLNVVNSGTPLNQFGGSHNHIVLAHSSLADIKMAYRTDFASPSKYTADAYCKIYGSVFYAMAFSSTADANLVIDRNHVTTGGAPAQATNSTTGSDNATMFTSPGTGDYTPKSGSTLLSNTIAAVVPFDLANNRRSLTATARGAYAASTEANTNQTVLSGIASNVLIFCGSDE